MTGILAEAWNASIKPRLGHGATGYMLGAWAPLTPFRTIHAINDKLVIF